jgi:hypothetical protein
MAGAYLAAFPRLVGLALARGATDTIQAGWGASFVTMMLQVVGHLADAHRGQRRYDRTIGWRAVLVFVIFLSETVALQWFVGAYASDYSSYASDEAAHFVTSLMLRDFMVEGVFTDPWGFAREYYLHYPKVALGHWPPVLHTAVAGWMLVGGTSRTAMMAFVAACAAANATVIYLVGRRLLGRWAGWFGGVLFLALPLTQESSAQLMTEHLVTLLMLVSVLQFARFVRTDRAGDALASGTLATLAILTRGSAWALIAVPPLVIFLTRRVGLLRSVNLWKSAIPVLLICVPWYILTIGIWTSDGSWIEDSRLYWLWALIEYPVVIARALGVVIVVLTGVGLWSTVIRPWRSAVDPTWAALLALALATVMMHTAAPTPVDARYMLTVMPSLLLLAAAGVDCVAALIPSGSRSRFVTPLVASGVAVVSLSVTFELPTHIHGEGYGALSSTLVATSPAAPRVYVIASDPHGEGGMVAAMASRENRPGSIVLRGSKILTREDWFGRLIEDRFDTVEEVSRILDRIPVEVVILDNALSEAERSAYYRRLEAVVSGPETEWREVGAFPLIRAGRTSPQGLRMYVKRSPSPVPVTVDRALVADLVLPGGVR